MREAAPLDERRVHGMEDVPAGESSQSLVARARAGDHDAYHSIFNRYSKPLLSFIYNLVGDRNQAEELVQEAFVRAYRRFGSMRDGRHLSSWLFGIARNVVREAVKRKYSERASVSLEQIDRLDLRDSRIGPDEPMLADELNRAVHEALAGLSEDGRAVFVLKVLHRMRYREISRVTGSSVGKLKTDLHRARLQMRRRLMHYLGEDLSGMRGEL
jgi:RNA polymerase sigma-70 factor (ECF subfamily)